MKFGSVIRVFSGNFPGKAVVVLFRRAIGTGQVVVAEWFSSGKRKQLVLDAKWGSIENCVSVRKREVCTSVKRSKEILRHRFFVLFPKAKGIGDFVYVEHDGKHVANFVWTIGYRGFCESEVPMAIVGEKSAFSARFGIRIEYGIVDNS